MKIREKKIRRKQKKKHTILDVSYFKLKAIF